MTEGESAHRFEPRRRRSRERTAEYGRENMRAELARILDRATAVAGAGREQFAEGGASYDVASMAVIRLAALLERPEFAASARLLTPDEVVAIRTTRNIAARAGYDGMNDDLFWAAVTSRIPAIVRRLLDGA